MTNLLSRFTLLLFLIVAALGIAASAFYALGTQNTLEATITHTERTCDDRDDCYWLVMTDDRVFANRDSLWHVKWRSSDLQARLAPGSSYALHYYGWRIPFFSVYPNLVEATPLDATR